MPAVAAAGTPATAEIIIGTSVGTLLLLVGALGWAVRSVVASYTATRAELHRLATYIEVDKVVGPTITRRLDDMEDVVQENVTQLAVLRAWQSDHDRWHERRGLAPRPHDP